MVALEEEKKMRIIIFFTIGRETPTFCVAI